MRGEHPISPPVRIPDLGSSPHARGTLKATVTYNHNIGIIPACAGNTNIVRGSLLAVWDHPRMRGEHFK